MGASFHLWVVGCGQAKNCKQQFSTSFKLPKNLYIPLNRSACNHRKHIFSPKYIDVAYASPLIAESHGSYL